MLWQEFGLAKDQRYAVAFSGGADSMALLLALHEMLVKRQSILSRDISKLIIALHFNHAINVESDQWQKICQQRCEELKVGFLCSRWNSAAHAEVNEGEARQARYQWFNRVVNADQVLLTAHHADDQVETVLMHLFQGHGLSRLAGIPPVRSLEYGDSRKVYRPLLGFSGASLRQYLDDGKYQWIEDPANRDQRFTRNFVRAQLIPLIKRRWPNVLESVSASAANLSQVNTLLSATLEKSLAEVMAPEARRVFCVLPPLKIEKLIDRPLFEFCQLLRHWIHKARFHSPSEAQLKSLHMQLIERQQDRVTPKSKASLSPCKLHWNGMNIVSYGEHMFIFRDFVTPDGNVMPFKLSHSQLVSGLEVRFQNASAGGLSIDLLKQENLNWRWRKGGEQVKLPGRQHRSSLKKLLQHNRIPEWERKYLPYLEEKGEIVWIHGIGITKNYIVPEGRADQLIPEFALVRSTNNSI